MKDYSQSGEQALILDWAQQLGRKGRWLDIGAFDGTTASNTRALAEKGWPGVAVEAAAFPFDRLAWLYRDHDDVECVQAALFAGPFERIPGGDDVRFARPSLVRFHYTRDLVSTTQAEHAETWSEVTDFAPCWVATISVVELLEFLPGPYDLVSIDTEGTSIEIFSALREFDAFERHALAVVEAEDGGERWEIQQACLSGWARVGVTPNNVLLERL